MQKCRSWFCLKTEELQVSFSCLKPKTVQSYVLVIAIYPKGTFLNNTTDVTLMLQRHFWSELLCFTADKIHAETIAINVDVLRTGYHDIYLSEYIESYTFHNRYCKR